LNGAGKTTLFNAVSGFLPYAGDIRREGRSLRGRTAAAIAREGVVQSPEGRELFGAMTVSENLDMGGQRLKENDRAERREWLFDLFPILKERRTQTAATLSGGEQQMLTICRTLMGDPDLIMIDEPTEGLSPMMVEHVGRLLEEIARRGVAILLIEQKLTIALRIAHRLYVMGHGKIVYEGSSAELAAAVDIRKEWLEV
jgi:branched-chain amino acid transport system ATP-binding protein